MWIQDALQTLGLCLPYGPIVSSLPPPGSIRSFRNLLLYASPNPSFSGHTKIRFAVAKPTTVTIRLYDVAGRIVHSAQVEASPDIEGLYAWDGMTRSGVQAAPGVYFYRLFAPGVEFENNKNKRLVILSGGP